MLVSGANYQLNEIHSKPVHVKLKNATKDETDLQVIYLQIKPKTFLKGEGGKQRKKI